jgi:hypothetical protein
MKLNRKNKFLILGFIIALYLSYSFAISKSLFYRNQYIQNKEMANKDNQPKVLANLKYKEKQIDLWMSKNIFFSSNFQNELLKELTISSNLYDTKIVDFQKPHIFIEKNNQTTSYSFSIEGSFNGVLRLINDLENKQSLGQIKHIFTIKKNNYKINKDYLVTTIIVQTNQ